MSKVKTPTCWSLIPPTPSAASPRVTDTGFPIRNCGLKAIPRPQLRLELRQRRAEIGLDALPSEAPVDLVDIAVVGRVEPPNPHEAIALLRGLAPPLADPVQDVEEVGRQLEPLPADQRDLARHLDVKDAAGSIAAAHALRDAPPLGEEARVLVDEAIEDGVG